MDKAHEVQSLSFSGDRMFLTVDGKDYQFEIAAHSRKLVGASMQERERFRISASGYGIHWPDLDEDLSIDGLLGVEHHCPFAKSRT